MSKIVLERHHARPKGANSCTYFRLFRRYHFGEEDRSYGGAAIPLVQAVERELTASKHGCPGCGR